MTSGRYFLLSDCLSISFSRIFVLTRCSVVIQVKRFQVRPF